jgi:two-component system sensor histidine kinase UhpB
MRASREQFRELLFRLEEEREIERTRLARALHDGVAQALTAARMELYMINDPPTSASNFAERLGSTSTMIEEAICCLRKIECELRPGILDLGLEPAVEWAVEDFQALSGIGCDLHMSLAGKRVSPQLVTQMFRIVQSVLRHLAAVSVASRIVMRLTGNSFGLLLTAQSSGCSVANGLNPSSIIDLVGLRVRVGQLLGRITVRQAGGAETFIRIRIPEPASV